MAGLQVFDLGGVIKDAEAIKAAREARNPNNPRNRLLELQVRQAEQDLRNPAQGEQYGYNFVWGTDADGNLAAFQPARGGGVRQVEFPDGVTPQQPVTMQDMGPYLQGFNRFGQRVGEPQQQQTPTEQTPEFQAQVTTAKTEAEQEAKRNAPDILFAKQQRGAEASDALVLVDALLGDALKSDIPAEQRNIPILSAYGKYEGNPFVPDIAKGQETIDAAAQRDQVIGLLSLESRQKLKGQGTITDSEAKTLEKSATVLASPYISDDLIIREMVRVRGIFARAAARNKLSPAQMKAIEGYAPEDSTPVVNSQAEYDALPSGAEFIEDGQRYRKP